ncbi:MAG: accessory factor UbiK family protein [Alphaproteobacteria bacterium]
MQAENRFLDDLARVANGAIGALSGVRTEIEAMVKQRVERLLADMDLVTRDEFDAVKAVAAKARSEQETLESRVAALESALSKTKAKPATRRKRAASAAKSKPA